VFFTIEGSAGNGLDYELIEQFVDLFDGESSVTIDIIPVLNGDVFSKDIKITLLPDSEYIIVDSDNATVVIEPIPQITIVATDGFTKQDGSEGNANLRVARSHSIGDITVNLDFITAGVFPAIPGEDFEPIDDFVVLLEGEDFIDIPIIPIDNAKYDPNQLVLRTDIRPDPLYVVGVPGEADVVIEMVKSIVTIAVVGSDTIAEGGTGTFRISRTDTGGLLKVVITLTGTAVGGTDYDGITTLTWNIPNGENHTDIVVTVLDRPPGSKTLTVTIFPEPPYTVGSPSNATMTFTYT
jgi:hypothetical protein